MKRPGNKWWTVEPNDKDYEVKEMGAPTACWVWRWGKTGGGYGYLAALQKGSRVMHRWFYEQKHGKIPKNLQLDHLCRVRACVNPSHLEPVSGAENTRRGPQVKLKAGQVTAIREMKKQGVSATWLAKVYGVSKWTVFDLCNGRSWQAPGRSKNRHVEGK